MKDKLFDIAVIGGGPAGYTAALYAARAGLSVIVAEQLSAGGQMTEALKIDNYPGFENGIDGFTLGEKMRQGAEKYGAETLNAAVTKAELSETPKRLFYDRGEIRAETVIIAAGADHRKLGLADEERLAGRGVSYCASCDGNFYRGKTVAVIGGGNSAVADALLLSRICSEVHIIHRRDTLRAEKIYNERLETAGNIFIHFNRTVKGISGENTVDGITIGGNGGETEFLPCGGVFISIGRAPRTELFKGIVKTDENGYIAADETTATDIPGVFAAGDIRTKPFRQIVTAAADGAVAAYFAGKYVLHRTGEKES